MMKNVFNTKNTVHERYDLKGSWVGRRSSAVKRGSQAHCRQVAAWVLEGLCPRWAHDTLYVLLGRT